MVTLEQADTRRHRKRITLTRIIMDEVEFKRFYNHACNMADKITEPDTKSAIMCVLQLVWDVHERLVDMQLEEDDDE